MAEALWQWSFCARLPSSRHAGQEAIEKLLAALADAGWDGRDYFHVQMAVEEAMVNAVTHGNKEANDKFVEIEFRVATERAFLRIKDQGEGFSPETLPDPRDDEHLELTNGRGVMLIKEMMCKVSYVGCGNEVIMEKNRRLE